jgi:hypothetical protein
MTWRVMFVGDFGDRRPEGGCLGVLVHLALEAVGGHRAEGVASVGDGHRAPDLPRQALGGPAVDDELVAPARELLDRVGDVLRRAGEQADALEHDERRHADRPDPGSRHRAVREDDVRGAPRAGEGPPRAAGGQDDHARAGAGGGLGRLHRLLRVA